MNRLLLILALCVGTPFAGPEALELELTIEGTPEEIMAILDLLHAHGIGGAAEAAATDEEGLHFEIQSSIEGAATDAAVTEAAPAEPPPPRPPLRLENATATPEEVTPGQQAVLTVTAVDEAHSIDTMSAALFSTDIVLDLFDNGANGDAAANDGQWTGVVQIPPDSPARSQRIDITAYDANGTILTQDHQGQRSLTARARIQVVKPVEAPPEEAPAPPAEEAPVEAPPAAPAAP